MRDTFIGYYDWTKEEFDELWSKALFVFDTNTLLNIYRYTEGTCEQFLETLEVAKDRIWIPYQVGSEFHRNRRSTIVKQVKAYNDLTACLEQYSKEFDTALGEYKNHKLIDREKLNEEFSEAIEKMKESICESEKNHPDYTEDDPVLEKVSLLFDGRVGTPLTDDELKKHCAEGKKRYAAKIPPGFKDHKKPEPQCYGDFFIWLEMISKAEKEKRPIIFVTSDTKEDWWRNDNGKRSPRPDLLQEFREKTKQFCYFYTPKPFITYARKYFDLEAATQETLKEIKEVRESNAWATRMSKVNPGWAWETGTKVGGMMSGLDTPLHRTIHNINKYTNQNLFSKTSPYQEYLSSVMPSSSLSAREAYNLACFAALRGEPECEKWLNVCRDNGALPDCEHIRNDTDLDFVRDEPWFIKFMEEECGE
ncbi:MAG: PIN domain-containing protein [Pseudodesulfovibrio sp.]